MNGGTGTPPEVPLDHEQARRTERRRRQIRWLLASLNDFTFEPETFTGRIVRKAAGTGTRARVTEYRDCDGCAGTGRTRLRGVTARCDRCKGRGRVKVDAYTGDRVATLEHVWTFAELLERDTRTARCDACDGQGATTRGRCRHCNGSGRAAIPGSWLSDPDKPTAGSDPVDAVLNTIERRRTIGSYGELEQGLIRLRDVDRSAARVLLEVFTHRTVEEDAADPRLIQFGLSFLDAFMPDPIVVPTVVVAAERRRRQELLRRDVKGHALSPEARRQRDREIVRLVLGDGRASQWVARQAGLSVASVNRIVSDWERRTKGAAA